MKKNNFFDAYTDFQCLIIAQLNKMDFDGISAVQYNIIEYLHRNGSNTSSHLAKKFSVSLPAISRQVKILVEQKLIKQQRDTADRRLYYLSATEKGRKLVNSSESIRQHMTSIISKILTEKELDSFTAACQKIVQHFA